MADMGQPERPSGSFGEYLEQRGASIDAAERPPSEEVLTEAFAAASSWTLELFSNGKSIGWLGEDGGQWCVVAASGGAVAMEFYSYNNVLYIRNAGDTSRYLSVSDGYHYVGFYNWMNARGWTLNGGVLTSQYTNCSLAYWPGGVNWVYANSGSGYAPLTVQLHPVSPPKITNVFVLMLENHSFDNIFAFSGIPGINAATPDDSNTFTYQGTTKTYKVASPAPTSTPTDPGHEFLDTVEQLAGEGYKWQNGQQYPPVTDAGYVANYATTDTEIVPPGAPRKPYPSEFGDVMLCFDTKKQLPVIYTLATEFAICDQWYSSIPGPTWPNRFFVHGASSVNWDDSPTGKQIAEWELNPFGAGFVYPHGSIYDRLRSNGIPFRLYADEVGPIAGRFPQVAAINGLHQRDVNGFSSFKSDVQGTYPYKYTFIEPSYGAVYGGSDGGSYKGGSSQHPMDGMHNGEALIKATYEALRASPLWPTSLLIITYDEHGGFYDSGKPTRDATPPGDGGSVPANQHGFRFDQYGVRVPAVVVSPLIAKGAVDHTKYDHSSVLATLEQLWGLAPLTQRDAHANDVLGLVTLSSARTDCPMTLPNPVPDMAREALPAETLAALGDQPLPDQGNTVGFLAVVHKADLELSGGDEEEVEAKRQRYAQITTRAEAAEYAAEVYTKVEAARRGQRPGASTTLTSAAPVA